jgi:predicted MFS family arabinose efflux permease
MALTALAAAQTESMTTLAVLILVLNLFAATQDIAVDALAVSWLEPHQLGPGNAVQVVGYKLGMLTGGGLLVWASDYIGWPGLFRIIAALMLVVLLFSLLLHEPRAPQSSAELPNFGAIFKRLRQALRERPARALLAVVVSYKTGEALADAMWKPMLLDQGFRAADIGLWSGTFGMLCSLLGSASAGFLVRRIPLPTALVWLAMLRTFGVAGEWWVSQSAGVGPLDVITVTCLEHLLGGGLTTVLFAMMMQHSDREIGATHYTLLASVEVLGKLPVSTLSGVIAANFGYPALFATAATLCALFALLAHSLRPALASEPMAQNSAYTKGAT